MVLAEGIRAAHVEAELRGEIVRQAQREIGAVLAEVAGHVRLIDRIGGRPGQARRRTRQEGHRQLRVGLCVVVHAFVVVVAGLNAAAQGSDHLRAEGLLQAQAAEQALRIAVGIGGGFVVDHRLVTAVHHHRGQARELLPDRQTADHAVIAVVVVHVVLILQHDVASRQVHPRLRPQLVGQRRHRRVVDVVVVLAHHEFFILQLGQLA